jgi:hypothetical protein
MSHLKLYGVSRVFKLIKHGAGSMSKAMASHKASTKGFACSAVYHSSNGIGGYVFTYRLVLAYANGCVLLLGWLRLVLLVAL